MNTQVLERIANELELLRKTQQIQLVLDAAKAKSLTIDVDTYSDVDGKYVDITIGNEFIVMQVNLL